jgi:hypothetical protein
MTTVYKEFRLTYCPKCGLHSHCFLEKFEETGELTEHNDHRCKNCGNKEQDLNYNGVFTPTEDSAIFFDDFGFCAGWIENKEE